MEAMAEPGAFVSSFCMVARARVSFRTTMTMRAPCLARSRTAASPMPDVAPVATMVLPFMFTEPFSSGRDPNT